MVTKYYIQDTYSFDSKGIKNYSSMLHQLNVVYKPSFLIMGYVKMDFKTQLENFNHIDLY